MMRVPSENGQERESKLEVQAESGEKGESDKNSDTLPKITGVCQSCPKLGELLGFLTNELGGEHENGFMEVLQFSTCGHEICTDCVKNKILENKAYRCPIEDCQKSLNSKDLRQVCSSDIVRNKRQEELREETGIENLVVCRCGEVCEFEAGDVYYDIKGDDQLTISRNAAQHLAENRLRCNSCSDDFCVTCGQYPYHKGYTCKEFKFKQNFDRCKYC